MAISDKTRKILWTRSGNKCSICKARLITLKSEPFTATIVGEECHIVSAAQNGPRYNEIQDYNYDRLENLILLCSNCHKIVDDQIDYYGVDKLKIIKEKHEEEVRTLLEKTDPTNNFKKIDDITVLPKVHSGKELLYLLDDCMAFETDYEDTKDEREIGLIASIMQTLTDYSDFLSSEPEPGPKISIITELNKLLEEIDNSKFALFGEKKKQKITFDNGKSDIWNVSTLYLMKIDNPNVVDLSKN